MSITPDEVEKIAHLARLSFSDTEIQPLKKDLDNILNLVGKMKNTDVSKVEALAHPMETPQPLRTDVATEENQRDLFLQLAPQTKMGLYIVPQVLDTE